MEVFDVDTRRDHMRRNREPADELIAPAQDVLAWPGHGACRRQRIRRDTPISLLRSECVLQVAPVHLDDEPARVEPPRGDGTPGMT